jgi:tetratricopeptide (TPR) repeat protein
MPSAPHSRIRTVLGALIAALALSAFYLYAFPSPTVAYVGLVVLHAALGLAALLVFAVYAVRNWRTWSRAGWASWLVFALAGILGIVLLWVGTARPEWRWLYAHEILSVVAVVLLALRWLAARGNLGATRTETALRSAGIVGLAALVIFLSHYNRLDRWTATHRIQNPGTAPESMDLEGDGPRGPFFPSSAQTVDGKLIPGRFFMESESCKRCHQDIYNQWYSSAHHFSSFNNQWYRKSVEYMQDVVGTRPSKWCGGCHDPAVLYSGMMDTPIKQIVKSPEAQAGLGCVMCHSIAKVKSTMGQGDFVLEYPRLHDLAASKNPLVRTLHDYLIRLNPEPHRRVFLKPFMRAQPAEFCSTCHKVHLDVPVNHYRWIRGFNEYDNWQASAVSGEGARSFYYPDKPSTCTDCHMPTVPSRDDGQINGLIHSHSFPAANSALPTANQDAKQLQLTENFLKGSVTVDIFALSPARDLKGGVAGASEQMTTFGVGEEAESRVTPAAGLAAVPVTAPLNRVNATVRRGDDLLVDVVVRTRKVGHFFPGGTVDAYDTWLELKATDDKGQVIFWSGRVEDGGHGPVEKGAHFYRSLMVDANGNPINKRNAWATRALVYVHLIPPGAADAVHYRLHIPENAGARISLEARLCYRKFAWWNTQFSFAGVPDPAVKTAAVTPDYDDRATAFTGDLSGVSGKLKYIPDLPIVVLSEDKAALNVALRAARPDPPRTLLDSRDWTRWNDYGIGLFLQGDLKGAAAAFEKITQIDPRNPDGWVNLGRVAVQEGDLERARQVLEHALQISPALARANYFYARVLRNLGRYDEAELRLRTVLAQYPRDRVAINDLGRILVLRRQYASAIQVLQSVLEIDPEDLQAHYNLMLCYQGLGKREETERERRLYLRFKADEASQTITGPYRRLHAEDNNERQAIHEHVSAPLGPLPARRANTRTGAAGGEK